MALTNIPWCHYTYNKWYGCTKIDIECDNCYAEYEVDHRYHLLQWGKERRATTTANDPPRWNRKAQREGVRFRVFCNSWGDVFDNKADPTWRDELWALIRNTLYLDWLLLTKRPQNIRKMLPPGWPWHNVWLGTTAGYQGGVRRVPVLLRTPAVVHFVSVEPMLEPVDLRHHLAGVDRVICASVSSPNR